MSSNFIYLLEVSLCFSAFYLVYHLGLRKLTFHHWNRLILLAILPISFLLPLFKKVTLDLSQVEPELLSPVENILLEIESSEQYIQQTLVQESTSWHFPFEFIYWGVVAFFFVRLLFTLAKVFALRWKSTPYILGKQIVYQGSIPSIFSSFGWIFVPKEQIATLEKPVLLHELAHIRLRHTLDLLLTEVYVGVFWFNPFVYLYRHSIKTLHEYQADQAVILQQVQRSHYLTILLKHLHLNTSNNLHSPFNYLTIKNRVDMLLKPGSRKRTITRYMVFLPLFVVLSFAFTSINLESHIIIKTEMETEEPCQEDPVPPSMFPLKSSARYKITSGFGMRIHPIFKKEHRHNGIDIQAEKGTEIVATADGTVKTASLKGNYGNLIVIQHDGGYETYYAHLEGFKVKVNQEVKAGEVIGFVGSTGKSFGPHLHYEIRIKGKVVDPEKYIAQ